MTADRDPALQPADFVYDIMLWGGRTFWMVDGFQYRFPTRDVAVAFATDAIERGDLDGAR